MQKRATSLLKTAVTVMPVWAGTAPGTAQALTHRWFQRKGAAAAQVSTHLMSLPGAGDSSLTGGSCALVAVLSSWVKELQEEVSSLRSSQEEEQEMAGSSQRLSRGKDHPSPVLQRRENLLPSQEQWMQTPIGGKAGNLLLPATQKGSFSICSSATAE